MALIVGMLVLPLSAGTRRDDRPDNLYRDLAALPQYASVGQLSITGASGGSYLGSGTLIGADWVLTAAHCVDIASQLTFKINGQSYAASQWVANPGWNGNPLHGGDVGLIHLSQPVANVKAAVRYTGSGEVGKAATIVGYGKTGTGSTGAKKYDGQKRAGQNVLDATYGASSTGAPILLADFDNPKSPWASSMGSAKPLDLEYMIAPGDSGGGVFIDVNGTAQLAGVNSFLWAVKDGNPNASYSDVGGFERVSAYNGWIDGMLASFANGTLAGWGSQVGGLAPIPEPASLGLLALGLGAVLAGRRRKS